MKLFHNIHALLIIILTIVMIVVSLVLFIVIFGILGSDKPADIKWVTVSFSFIFILFAFVHLNMWRFYLKVKKLNPEVAKQATQGVPYASYIGGQRGHIDIQLWIKQILDGEFGEFPVQINNYAKFTLWVNKVFLWYCLIVVIAVLIVGLVTGSL